MSDLKRDARCPNVHPTYGRCERPARIPHERHMTMSYKSSGLNIQPTQWYDEDVASASGKEEE